MKIFSVGAELFYADRQTEKTNLKVFFFLRKLLTNQKHFILDEVGAERHKSRFRLLINVTKHNVCTSKVGFSYYHSYRFWTSIFFTESPVKRIKFCLQG